MSLAPRLDALPDQPSLTDQVYHRLLDAIFSGQFDTGTPLRQEKLAELLAVSRQPVSHALALLRQQGVVVPLGRRGVAVAAMDPEYLKDIYEIRALLEPYAARRCAERGGAGPELGRCLAAGRAARRRGDIAALVRQDIAFHRCLARHAGNRFLDEITETQWLHIGRAMGQALQAGPIRSRAWDEHEALSAAITAGEADRAARLAGDHVRTGGAETYRRLTLVSRRQPD